MIFLTLIFTLVKISNGIQYFLKISNVLTHFLPMASFHTPWKCSQDVYKDTSGKKCVKENSFFGKTLNDCFWILRKNIAAFNLKVIFQKIYPASKPAGKYMLKFNNRNTRSRCKICSKLTIKMSSRRSEVFVVNFEHISHLDLVLLLLTLIR